MNILKLLKEDMATQKRLLQVYQKALARLPKGRLCFKLIDGKPRYFKWDEQLKKQVYIRKQDENLVYALKYRRILQEVIHTIEQNLKAEEKLLLKYQPYDPQSCQTRLGKVYQDLPEKFYRMPKQVTLVEGYQNNYRTDELKHVSSFGMKFRSKLEVLIAELLHNAGVPFTYEAKLILEDEFGETHYYKPDFTFILPDGRRIIWEHFGRMDLPEYRKKNFKRLAIYHYNDIYPPKNLIITMESKDGGIDIDAIQAIIDNQLLPLFQV